MNHSVPEVECAPTSHSGRLAVFNTCTTPCSVDTANSEFWPRLAPLVYAQAYGGLMYVSLWIEWHLNTSDLFEDTKAWRMFRVGTVYNV